MLVVYDLFISIGWLENKPRAVLIDKHLAQEQSVVRLALQSTAHLEVDVPEGDSELSSPADLGEAVSRRQHVVGRNQGSTA